MSAFHKRCVEEGKACKGTVKKRRILSDTGVLRDDFYTVGACDYHYKRDLRRVVKRGRAAADMLAALGK